LIEVFPKSALWIESADQPDFLLEAYYRNKAAYFRRVQIKPKPTVARKMITIVRALFFPQPKIQRLTLTCSNP
jgi:hypothetical protein